MQWKMQAVLKSASFEIVLSHYRAMRRGHLTIKDIWQQKRQLRRLQPNNTYYEKPLSGIIAAHCDNCKDVSTPRCVAQHVSALRSTSHWLLPRTMHCRGCDCGVCVQLCCAPQRWRGSTLFRNVRTIYQTTS